MYRINNGLLILTVILAAAAAIPFQSARANGYAVYPSPLAWSPDGRFLAAALAQQWPQEEARVQGELFLFDEFGRSQSLAPGLVGSPSFRADGRMLAAVVDGDVWAFGVEEGSHGRWQAVGVGAVTNRGDVLDCRYGPGREPLDDFLHYTAGERFYGCKVYVLRWPELTSELVLDAGAEASVLSPGMLPGAGDIYFLRQPGQLGGAYERLSVYRPARNETTQLTLSQQRPDDYHESNFIFIPGAVIFQRGGWGDWNLYRIDLATGKEHLELTDAESPAASADGRYLAFARRDAEAKAKAEYDWEVPPTVWLLDRGSGSSWRVSTPGVEASYPAVAPDGSRLAWIEREGDRPRVMIRTIANLAETRPGQ